MIDYLVTMLGEGVRAASLDLFGYFVTAGIFALLVFKLKPARLMARKIQPNRQAGQNDIRREIRASVRTGLIFGGMAMVGYNLNQLGIIRIYGDIGDYGVAYFILSFAMVFVAHDAWFYWTHRMMHHKKLFKHMHVTHHLSRVPTPFTAFSFDPLEAVSHALFTTVYLTILPTHPIVMITHFIVMIIRNVMGHAGYELMPKWWLNSRLTSWINTTTHHDLHHQRGPTNFSLYFTWWDKWMGTEHPDYKERFHEAWARSDEVVLDAGQVRSSKIAARVTAGLVGVVAGVGMLLATSVGRADDGSITDAELTSYELQGRWVSAKKDIVLDIGPCLDNADEWCGEIVWVPDENGGARLDKKNKDPNLQTRPLIGVMMGWGFQEKVPGLFEGGRVYSPDDGNTYRGKVRVTSRETVELDGCVFVFCRTENLERYQPGMKLYDPEQDKLIEVTLGLGRQYAQD